MNHRFIDDGQAANQIPPGEPTCAAGVPGATGGGGSSAMRPGNGDAPTSQPLDAFAVPIVDGKPAPDESFLQAYLCQTDHSVLSATDHAAWISSASADMAARLTQRRPSSAELEARARRRPSRAWRAAHQAHARSSTTSPRRYPAWRKALPPSLAVRPIS